jgi:alkylation response protein AidB-like acyl-CoA dehydrogenase
MHGMVMVEEITRSAGAGILTALLTGITIGLPPILKYGSKELCARLATPCLTGEKLICLAVTEPWAGSDVGALRTRAVKSTCGKFYTVNGMKKWITNGIYCDYFTTAVVTDPESGMFGLSLLVIDAHAPGVSKRKMKV